MRTVDYQYPINDKIVQDNIRKLKTSINNYTTERGHDANIRLRHLQNDCLSLFLALEQLSFLQLMRDMPEIPWPEDT